MHHPQLVLLMPVGGGGPEVWPGPFPGQLPSPGGPGPGPGQPGQIPAPPPGAPTHPIALPPNQVWPPPPASPIIPPNPPPGSVWPPIPPGSGIPAGKTVALLFVSGYGWRYAVVEFTPQPV